MERAQDVDETRMCLNNCGFFGSPQTGGMCSKCFKDTAAATRATIEAPAPVQPLSTTMPAATTSAPSVTQMPAPAVVPSTPSKNEASAQGPGMAAEGGGAASSGPMCVPATPSDAESTPAKKKNRCNMCNKKLGFTAIECRCGMVFCGVHRYPEQHQCTFDFKSHDRENLKKVVMGGGEFAKIEHL